ncbi:hypothetical protein QQM79_14135 [Marinobacteraceae bacterium S3BR75-40.1]
MLNLWPRIAVALILLVFGFGGWLWFRAPWLVDPLWVAKALETNALPDDLLWAMALILPLVVLTCLLLVIALIVVAWTGFRREADYLALFASDPLQSRGDANDGVPR